MKKRLISLLLSVAVLTTSVPVSTFADPSAGQEPAVSSEESQEPAPSISSSMPK